MHFLAAERKSFGFLIRILVHHNNSILQSGSKDGLRDAFSVPCVVCLLDGGSDMETRLSIMVSETSKSCDKMACDEHGTLLLWEAAHSLVCCVLSLPRYNYAVLVLTAIIKVSTGQHRLRFLDIFYDTVDPGYSHINYFQEKLSVSGVPKIAGFIRENLKW